MVKSTLCIFVSVALVSRFHHGVFAAIGNLRGRHTSDQLLATESTESDPISNNSVPEEDAFEVQLLGQYSTPAPSAPPTFPGGTIFITFAPTEYYYSNPQTTTPFALVSDFYVFLFHRCYLIVLLG
jgi:hypothetical protein